MVFFKSADVGAWLQASYQAEEHRREKASVRSKPTQTSVDVISQHIKAEKDGTMMKKQQTADIDDGKMLDGFFLVRSCNCSGSMLSGKSLTKLQGRDFQLTSQQNTVICIAHKLMQEM